MSLEHDQTEVIDLIHRRALVLGLDDEALAKRAGVARDAINGDGSLATLDALAQAVGLALTLRAEALVPIERHPALAGGEAHQVSLVEYTDDAMREMVNARALWRAIQAAKFDLAAHDQNAPARLYSLLARLELQRKLNVVFDVGRVPVDLVRRLMALGAAREAPARLVIGRHALYAYEAAAGVRVPAMLLPVIDEMEFVAAADRQRHFEHLVVATNGEMALMRAVHPLDLVKESRDSELVTAVQQLWDAYLHLLDRSA